MTPEEITEALVEALDGRMECELFSPCEILDQNHGIRTAAIWLRANNSAFVEMLNLLEDQLLAATDLGWACPCREYI